MKSCKLLVVAAILAAWSVSLFGQAMPEVAQGAKAYGSFQPGSDPNSGNPGGGIDHVDLATGNLFLHAHLLSYPQRGGLAYPIVLQYNSKNFSFYSTRFGGPVQVEFGAPPDNPGQSYAASVTIGFPGFPRIPVSEVGTSLSLNGNPISVNSYAVETPDGSLHQLVTSGSSLWNAVDGSGFRAAATLHDSQGNQFAENVEDVNGNQLSATQDTLGRQIPAAPAPAPPDASGPNPSTASLNACPALNYPNQALTFAYAWNLPTVNGGTLPLILCYAGVYVRTNFFNGAKPTYLHELSQSFNMLQSVLLPDGTYWAFEYDAADPNNTASFAYGELLQMTYPSGGRISYTYGPWAGCTSASRAVQTRTVNANDGTGPRLWQYSFTGTVLNSAGQTTVVTDPAGNDTVHTITGLGGTCTPYETQTQYYQGSHSSGTLLKTVNTDYQFTLNPYDPTAISTGRVDMAKSVTNVFPIRVTTTLPNGLVSKVETDYDMALAYHGPLDGIQYNDQTCYTDPSGVQICSWTATNTTGVTNYTGSLGKVIATREYDWGQGAPGPLLRQTLTTYQWQLNSAYLAANLLDLPARVQVLDGAGNQVALTTYGYDEYTLNGSGVTTQHNANPVNGLIRGNLTSTHHWLNGSTVSTPSCPVAVSNGFLVSYAQYNDTGTVYQSTDACGTSAGDANHRTTHTYDLAYAGAYPTQTCNPLGQCVSGTYDLSTGLITSFTDANHQTSNFSYDQQWRMTQALAPTDPGSGLRPETDFDHSVLNQVKRSKRQTAGAWIVDYAYFDGLGRTKQTRLVDPEGDDYVDTTYDPLGRVSTVSNPHRAASSPTDGVTTTIYDALGRPTQVTHPDGTYASTSYAGRAVQVMDEGNGTRSVARISQSDALGRLQSVCEVSSTTLAMGNGATPTACGLDIAATGFLTSYICRAASATTRPRDC